MQQVFVRMNERRSPIPLTRLVAHDGTFFRRVRINMNGTFWQVFEYNTEFALEQVKEGVVTLDEMYVGMKDIPWIGTARVGHMRVAQGFEGDQLSSSKAMTFL